MAVAQQQHHTDTIADCLARPEEERVELIRGTIVEKPATGGEHGLAQAGTVFSLIGPFQRRGGGGPGGWWFLTELDIELGGEIFRPDVCGYRRERSPKPPRGRPVKLVPDWVCEILSESNASRDRVEKMETYFRSGLPHYWIIDPAEGTLEVYRRTDLAFARVCAAHRGQRVRAEPFDAVELSVDELLGDDPPEPT